MSPAKSYCTIGDIAGMGELTKVIAVWEHKPTGNIFEGTEEEMMQHAAATSTYFHEWNPLEWNEVNIETGQVVGSTAKTGEPGAMEKIFDSLKQATAKIDWAAEAEKQILKLGPDQTVQKPVAKKSTAGKNIALIGGLVALAGLGFYFLRKYTG